MLISQNIANVFGLPKSPQNLKFLPSKLYAGITVCKYGEMFLVQVKSEDNKSAIVKTLMLNCTFKFSECFAAKYATFNQVGPLQ